MLRLTFLLLMVCWVNALTAQDDNYTQVITKRAEKIVSTLGITDSPRFIATRNIIVQQYRDLGQIHDSKTGNLDSLHIIYINRLSAVLTPQQVEQVKDGMTYGVLSVTYKGYLDMLLTLTEEQKQQIMTWLVEAREKAMDEGSSEKKHQVFGKYKGRINNYLAKAGYDLKKAGEEWQKRLADAKKK